MHRITSWSRVGSMSFNKLGTYIYLKLDIWRLPQALLRKWNGGWEILMEKYFLCAPRGDNSSKKVSLERLYRRECMLNLQLSRVARVAALRQTESTLIPEEPSCMSWNLQNSQRKTTKHSKLLKKELKMSQTSYSSLSLILLLHSLSTAPAFCLLMLHVSWDRFDLPSKRTNSSFDRDKQHLHCATIITNTLNVIPHFSWQHLQRARSSLCVCLSSSWTLQLALHSSSRAHSLTLSLSSLGFFRASWLLYISADCVCTCAFKSPIGIELYNVVLVVTTLFFSKVKMNGDWEYHQNNLTIQSRLSTSYETVKQCCMILKNNFAWDQLRLKKNMFRSWEILPSQSQLF